MRWLTPYILHGAHQVDEDVVATHIANYLDRLQNYPNWPELTSSPNEQEK